MCPFTTLQLMNVEGLTRENVASHLQKYRILLKRHAQLPANAPLTPDNLRRLELVQTAVAQSMQQSGLLSGAAHAAAVAAGSAAAAATAAASGLTVDYRELIRQLGGGHGHSHAHSATTSAAGPAALAAPLAVAAAGRGQLLQAQGLPGLQHAQGLSQVLALASGGSLTSHGVSLYAWLVLMERSSVVPVSFMVPANTAGIMHCVCLDIPV